MQTMIVVSCYDKATDAYMRPFFMMTRGQAIRAFTDEVNHPESDVGKHPEDYALFQVGTWVDTGTIEGHEPICLARAHEVIQMERHQPQTEGDTNASLTNGT